MAKKYYLIGIGGISMSSLAVFLKIDGNDVAGSDLVKNERIDEISNFNIAFFKGHEEKNIADFDPDYVVITSAINNDNNELIWARKNNKKVVNRGELLGKISKKFKNVIAISGTHGKTTTTALISELFINAGLKPTIHIGGVLKKNNSNFLIGEKKFFITEACEYKNSFLSLKPNFGIILNVESDHMDFFKNLDTVQNSFSKFQKNSNVSLVHKGEYSFLLTTPVKSIVYQAINIRKNEQGYSFDLMENDKKIGYFQTNFLGKHNLENSISAIATAIYYKIPIKVIKKTLKTFHGVKRRFEKIGKLNDTFLIHDYAHHPSEIKKAIEQAKNYGKILTVFQPHTFSRTKILYEDFLTCFNLSDGLILVKTYSAREDESMGKSAYDLFVSIENRANAFNYLGYANDLDDARKKIIGKFNNYDCVLILGAGDIDFLAKTVF